MVFLLLAPYNDSMTLGQGFNSFLHLPRLNGAVTIPESSLQTQAARAGGAQNVSQVVSYSSRFVEKISEVVRSMNISAASSIKSGTIEVSGNSLSVDEAKFASSDLNAVISVKVINQTTTTVTDPEFKPLENFTYTSESFFETFGDCYVSGFLEGGDLHGIVSVKVMDASKKTEVETIVKGQMNGSGDSGEFTLGNGSGQSSLSAALSQTETTVTVNWSGGGQIKPDDEEWTLDTLVKAAAAFPSKVTTCPQRTWAILTRYDNNRSFVQWKAKNNLNIVVPDFNKVQHITSDLLDDYMEWKNNLTRINAVMANPKAYKVSGYEDAVDINIKAINLTIATLIAERKDAKAEMVKIANAIDNMNNNPGAIPGLLDMKEPVLWACRLPIPIEDPDANAATVKPPNRKEVVAGFPFASDDELRHLADPAPPPEAPVATGPTATAPNAAPSAVTSLNDAVKSAIGDLAKPTVELAKQLPAMQLDETPAKDLATPGILSTLDKNEIDWISEPKNKVKYAEFRFEWHVVDKEKSGGSYFNDAVKIKEAILPVQWPKQLMFQMVKRGNACDIVRLVQVDYDQLHMSHGSRPKSSSEQLTVVDLAEDEKVNEIYIGKGPDSSSPAGIAFIEIRTSAGQVQRVGSREAAVDPITRYRPYGGTTGLKGWWGRSGDVIDKIAPIWG
ncbi:hypothetical protein QBC35DRAFT_505299 [Podospora australis]|uniref:Jacalin-type lectin domain-containing protein n=1 Tax=Podospora australis TaxID=1536484 RepID=A0AAN6WML3_9PEZI|nr:hypothetical protein QBC35DRAFT_505299 [Podospora australis]